MCSTQTAGGGNAVCLSGIRCEEEEEEEDRYLRHYTPVRFDGVLQIWKRKLSSFSASSSSFFK